MSTKVIAQIVAVLVFAQGVFVQGSALAQGAIEVTTDKPVYDYGEVIRISVRVWNPSDETFELIGSSTCQAQFLFDSFDSFAHTLCTADEVVIRFGPGSERTWTWEIVPEILGLPASDGEHVIVGYYPNSELSDTVVVEAPEYLGGRVSVGLSEGTSDEQVASVKDSLNAEVLSSSEMETGISETWQISGTSVDEAVQRYSEDPRFTYFEGLRSIQYHEIVSVQEDPGRALRPEIAPAYPNPCRSECTIELAVSTSQVVRIAVFDPLGRDVGLIYEGPLTGGLNHRFSMNAGAFANGTYILRADGRYFSTSRLVQIVK